MELLESSGVRPRQARSIEFLHKYIALAERSKLISRCVERLGSQHYAKSFV
jgi:hypothetical protein